MTILVIYNLRIYIAVTLENVNSWTFGSASDFLSDSLSYTFFSRFLYRDSLKLGLLAVCLFRSQ
jgi:hypothetical protein